MSALSNMGLNVDNKELVPHQKYNSYLQEDQGNIFPHKEDSCTNIAVVNGERRSQYDVSDEVMVTSSEEVCREVKRLFRGYCNDNIFVVVDDAFAVFDALYDGRHPQYHKCETDYHDKQHVLDVTLATARLIWGYQDQCQQVEARFTDEEIVVGLLTALFHDVGYLRKKVEKDITHGAQFTKIHVSRSAVFLDNLLSHLGYKEYSSFTQQLVHYTGYEKPIESIIMPDKRWVNLGYLVGTADVIAQMADRMYLEKCAQYLYPEFVLGGMCEKKDSSGRKEVIYASSSELMEKTPGFMRDVINTRLVETFKSSYQFVEPYFNGLNPYIIYINKNYNYLLDQLELITVASASDIEKNQFLRRRLI